MDSKPTGRSPSRYKRNPDSPRIEKSALPPGLVSASPKVAQVLPPRAPDLKTHAQGNPAKAPTGVASRASADRPLVVRAGEVTTGHQLAAVLLRSNREVRIEPAPPRPLAVAQTLTAGVVRQADHDDAIVIPQKKQVGLMPLQGYDVRDATAELMKLLSAPKSGKKAITHANELMDQLKMLALTNVSSNVFNKSFLAALDNQLGRLSQFELADFHKRFDALLGWHLTESNRDVAGRSIATTIASRADFYLNEALRLAPRPTSPLRRAAQSLSRSPSPIRTAKAAASKDGRLRETVREQIRRLCEPMDPDEMMNAATTLAANLPLDHPWHQLGPLQARLADDLLAHSDAELAMVARNLINLATDLPRDHQHLATLKRVLVDVLALRGGLEELAEVLRETRFGPSVQKKTSAVGKSSALGGTGVSGTLPLDVAGAEFEALSKAFDDAVARFDAMGSAATEAALAEVVARHSALEQSNVPALTMTVNALEASLGKQARLLSTISIEQMTALKAMMAESEVIRTAIELRMHLLTTTYTNLWKQAVTELATARSMESGLQLLLKATEATEHVNKWLHLKEGFEFTEETRGKVHQDLLTALYVKLDDAQATLLANAINRDQVRELFQAIDATAQPKSPLASALVNQLNQISADLEGLRLMLRPLPEPFDKVPVRPEIQAVVLNLYIKVDDGRRTPARELQRSPVSPARGGRPAEA